MKRSTIVVTIIMVMSVGLVLTLSAQSPPVKRTDLVKAELTAMPNPVAYLWVGELAPGAATGKHAHPTPRFVYVLEGAVISRRKRSASKSRQKTSRYSTDPGRRGGRRVPTGARSAHGLRRGNSWVKSGQTKGASGGLYLLFRRVARGTP